jgi:hypothetical protein
VPTPIGSLVFRLSISSRLVSELGDETQHLYVVSPTNLQLLMESAELILSRWKSFGGWFATVEEL